MLSLLLGSAPFHIRRAQTAAVQWVGQVGEVATEWLHLRQRLLALQPREPVHRQTLHHLKKAQEKDKEELNTSSVQRSQTAKVNQLSRCVCKVKAAGW